MLPLDVFTNEDLMELPDELWRTAIGLRSNADDQGRGSARPAMLKAAIWPLRPEVTTDVLEEYLTRLDDLKYIQIWTDPDDGREYYAMREWPAVSHPQPSRHPEPPPLPQKRSRAAGSPLAGRSAVERESERESGWRDPAEGEEGEGAWRDAESFAGKPPSKFCHEHPGGTLTPCGPCGTAREQNKLWEKRQREKARAEFTETPY